jgi:hypothetical protein
MRYAVLLLALLGCSTPATDGEADAGSVATGLVDGGNVCTPANTGVTCVPIAACGGGYRYGCYGSTCPTGDTGGCGDVRASVGGEYSEVCCERAACTRVQDKGDAQCAKAGVGKPNKWVCPWSNGVALAKAPGACVLERPVVGGARAVDYCCDP